MDIPVAVIPFSVDRGAVFKTLAFSVRSGWPLWVFSSIGLLLIAIGCFFDLRCLIAGLIIIFTGLPIIMLFLFTLYMFDPKMLVNIQPHTVEKTSGGYIIRIFRKIDAADDIDAEDDSGSRYYWEQCDSLDISAKKLINKKDIGDYEVLYFIDSVVNVLFLPKMAPDSSFTK